MTNEKPKLCDFTGLVPDQLTWNLYRGGTKKVSGTIYCMITSGNAYKLGTEPCSGKAPSVSEGHPHVTLDLLEVSPLKRSFSLSLSLRTAHVHVGFIRLLL